MYDSEEFRRIVYDNQINDDEIRARMVDLSVPKFDVSAKFALEEILPQLGVKGIFGSQSDAFGVISDEPLAVSAIEHACRIRTDENGIEAAAYTGIGTQKLVNMAENPSCRFVLYVGQRRMFKRKLLEEYLESNYSV